MLKDLSAKYYQKEKERLKKRAREKYQDRPEEENEKKQEYGCKQYRSLAEDGKEKKWLRTI